MNKLSDISDRLDELYDAYESVMYLAGSVDGFDSKDVANILRPINRDLKLVMDSIEGLRKGAGLYVVN